MNVTFSPGHWEWRLTKDMTDVSKTVSIDEDFPDTVIPIRSSGGSPF